MKLIAAFSTLFAFLLSFHSANKRQDTTPQLDVSHLKYIGEVDKSCLSYTCELHEAGGGDFRIL